MHTNDLHKSKGDEAIRNPYKRHKTLTRDLYTIKSFSRHFYCKHYQYFLETFPQRKKKIIVNIGFRIVC